MENSYSRIFDTADELIDWQIRRGFETIEQVDYGDFTRSRVYDKPKRRTLLIDCEKIIDPYNDDEIVYLVTVTHLEKLENIRFTDHKLEIENNIIDKPKHYIGIEGIEVEDVLRNFIPRYENPYVAHRIASAIEYLLRSPLKNGPQDIEKARYNLTQALNYINGDFNSHGNNQ